MAIGINKKMINKIIYILIISLLFSSCGQEEEKQTSQIPEISIDKSQNQTSKQNLTLQPMQFKNLKNWYRDELVKALPAIKASCQQILKEQNEYMSNSELKIPTKSYQNACNKLLTSNITTSAELRYFLDKHFQPYLVLDNGNANGKFTAYYEASLEASANQSSRYPYLRGW